MEGLRGLIYVPESTVHVKPPNSGGDRGTTEVRREGHQVGYTGYGIRYAVCGIWYMGLPSTVYPHINGIYSSDPSYKSGKSCPSGKIFPPYKSSLQDVIPIVSSISSMHSFLHSSHPIYQNSPKDVECTYKTPRLPTCARRVPP